MGNHVRSKLDYFDPHMREGVEVIGTRFMYVCACVCVSYFDGENRKN